MAEQSQGPCAGIDGASAQAPHQPVPLYFCFFKTPLQEEVGALTTRLSSDCQAIVRCLATNINVAVRNGMQCIGEHSCCCPGRHAGVMLLLCITSDMATAWPCVKCGKVLWRQRRLAVEQGSRCSLRAW